MAPVDEYVVARRCGLCASAQRADLEHRLLNGEPIRLVSERAGVSESAVYRHLRNHLQPGALREVQGSESSGLRPEQFAARLVASLADISEVRDHARATGDGRLLLAACAQERETLSTLLVRLGMDGESVVNDLKEARALVVAIRAIVRDHPEAIKQIATELRGDSDGGELADARDALLLSTRSANPQPKEIPA